MPAASCQLVPADSAAVKKEYVRKWQQAQRDFARHQQEWNRFCSEERPAYERWVGQTFGARISELRATDEKLRELRQLIEGIEYHSSECGKTPRAFYQELLAAQKEGTSLLETLHLKVRGANDPADSGTGDDNAAGDRDNDGDHRARDPSDDDGDDRFDDDDDDFASEFDAALDALGEMLGVGRRPKPHPQEAKQRQLKVRDLYRKLCVRLHPDTGGKFNAETEKLWHQLQHAYEHQDLDGLEAIQAGLEIRLDPLGKHVSCSQLAAVMADLKQGVNSIRAMMRHARQDAAWGFAAWSAADRQRAERQIAAQFTQDQSLLTGELQYIEGIIRRWGKPAPNKRPKQPAAAAPRDERQLAFDL